MFGPRMEWHVCRTESGHEHRVAIGLQAIGMQSYLPVELLIGIHRGSKWTFWKPLFPGHVFAMFDPSRDIPKLRSIEGVDDLVRRDGKLVPVPDDVVRALRAAERRGLFDRASACRLAVADDEPLDERYAALVRQIKRLGWSKSRTAVLMSLLCKT
jgi:hypothetical protein